MTESPRVYVQSLQRLSLKAKLAIMVLLEL